MLLRMRAVSMAFGAVPLLDHADFQLDAGERVCLLGRNGAGKSTLLKIIARDLTVDEGVVERRPDLRTARLEQDVPAIAESSVYDIVAEGLGPTGELLQTFRHLSQELGSGEDTRLGELETIQHRLEAEGGWRMRNRIETVLSKLDLNADSAFNGLSGGLKRRALLGRALAGNPDILLLDEPTNHLDIQSIDWLENFLREFGGTVVFVTHDRVFLQKLATRIVELDRGRLTSWPGSYADYMTRKRTALETEAAQDALFDKRLAQEEAWIRQGIKARRTRNEGRVRALERLRAERAARRQLPGSARMQVQEAERSGKLVVETDGISFSYNGKPLIKTLSTTILRGDRVGIIGPNGVGKTTLINLLLGKLRPQQGTVRLGTRLQTAYFDQLRAQLDENRSLVQNVAGGADHVTVNGSNRHVVGYLQDFLFSPDRQRTPVRALSGGERNRLLLAKLFSQPANVLVLDEPTNDLDMDTLELLEQLLVDFSGTVLLVSHDRAFLNNVVTSTLVFEGNARIGEYVGGYDDWMRQRPEPPKPRLPNTRPAGRANPRPSGGPPTHRRPRKLSYKDQRELDNLPELIETLEQEQTRLTERMADPTFFKRDSSMVGDATRRIGELEKLLADAYRRWEELEASRNSG